MIAPRVFAFASFVLASFACLAADKTANATRPMTRFDRLVEKMMPQEKLDKAVGFFGPVAKKYMPVAEDFRREYQAATNRREVIVKYLPQAESALAEAKTMTVPARYEREKADYIRMAETFLTVLKFSTALGK